MTTVTSNTESVTVLAIPTISLAQSPTGTVDIGTTVTYTATLSEAVSGITVTFNNLNNTNPTATTNSSGIATVSYTYSTGGSWLINATIVINDTTITSNNITTNVGFGYSLSLTESESTVFVGGSDTFTATLTSSSGANIDGVTITLTDTTTGTSTTANTNSSGVATFSVTFTSTGNYSLQASVAD